MRLHAGKKKIAIFCDGTWNDLRMQERTNVSRLAQCVLPSDAEGTPQIVFYDEGVGVGSHINRTADELVKLLGGTLGKGLDRKVEVAYRFLVTNYNPGDDIYIFGFSRGAYTARSLCGMIRKVGILKRECFDMTPKAFDWYHDRRGARDPDLIQFRFTYGHDVASGDEDYARYLSADDAERVAEITKKYPVAPAHFDTLQDLFQSRDLPTIREFRRQRASGRGELDDLTMRTYRMMYVGLWDTVGSMGVPTRLGPISRVINRKYAFYDTTADPLIASLRHAVASDEQRTVFSSTPVSNTQDLNRRWAERRGYDVLDPEDLLEPDEKPDMPEYVPYALRPFQERFFPGDHGAVGGGNPQRGLYSHTLRWIAEGAEWAGLAFQWENMRGPRSQLADALDFQNPMAPCPGQGRKDILGLAGGTGVRPGPARSTRIGNSAYTRYCRDPGYPGQTLSALAGQPCPRAFPVFPKTWPPCTIRTWLGDHHGRARAGETS